MADKISTVWFEFFFSFLILLIIEPVTDNASMITHPVWKSQALKSNIVLVPSILNFSRSKVYGVNLKAFLSNGNAHKTASRYFKNIAYFVGFEFC